VQADDYGGYGVFGPRSAERLSDVAPYGVYDVTPPDARERTAAAMNATMWDGRHYGPGDDDGPDDGSDGPWHDSEVT
jgi:hypothetical protein